MTRSLEAAADRVGAQRATLRLQALVALCAALACVPLAALAPRAALALAIAAVLEAALAACTAAKRRCLVHELALDRDAYAIPEVRRYGAHMVEPRRRARLAGSLLRLRREAADPWSVVLGPRVADAWPQLEELGRELASPEYEVEPASAVETYELLTDGIRSPLYNPSLPEDELAVRLHHIEAGVHHHEEVES